LAGLKFQIASNAFVRARDSDPQNTNLVSAIAFVNQVLKGDAFTATGSLWKRVPTMMARRVSLAIVPT